jgi:hypothetical protein
MEVIRNLRLNSNWLGREYAPGAALRSGGRFEIRPESDSAGTQDGGLVRHTLHIAETNCVDCIVLPWQPWTPDVPLLCSPVFTERILSYIPADLISLGMRKADTVRSARNQDRPIPKEAWGGTVIADSPYEGSFRLAGSRPSPDFPVRCSERTCNLRNGRSWSSCSTHISVKSLESWWIRMPCSDQVLC